MKGEEFYGRLPDEWCKWRRLTFEGGKWSWAVGWQGKVHAAGRNLRSRGDAWMDRSATLGVLAMVWLPQVETWEAGREEEA